MNILIDHDRNTCLTGFNLITMASEQSTIASPWAAGVVPWMSPELLHPGNFGLKNNHPTVKSDIYALGMVIYEVISGQAPFAAHRDPEVVFMVISGEHPKRPQGDAGELLTDGIWEVLELCWREQPNDRPNVNGVLSALEGGSSMPPSGMDEEAETDTDDEQSAAHTQKEIDIESRSCIEGMFTLPRSKVISNRLCVTLGWSIMDDSDEIMDAPLKRPPKHNRVHKALKKLFKL